MTTEAQKKAMKKYLASPKGRLARRRAQDHYNHSVKGRAAKRRYFQSSKGKEALARYRTMKDIMK